MYGTGLGWVRVQNSRNGEGISARRGLFSHLPLLSNPTLYCKIRVPFLEEIGDTLMRGSMRLVLL